MIILYNNIPLDLYKFRHLLSDKVKDLDTVFYIGEQVKSFDVFDQSQQINQMNFLEIIDGNMLHKIFFNILRSYYYESSDSYINKIIFLEDFSILENNVCNDFLKIIRTKDKITSIFLNSEYRDYSCAIAESGILNVELNTPWFGIFYFNENDLDIYPYPIRIVEIDSIVREYTLSSNDIFLDDYIGYYIIRNDNKEKMFEIKLSLPQNFKMITSYDWDDNEI